MSDAKQLQDNFRHIIGKEIVFISSTDDARHFDPISFAAAFGAFLLIKFLKATGERLMERAGVKVADKIWDVLTQEFDPESFQEDMNEQARIMDNANAALSEINQHLKKHKQEIEGFLDAGAEAVKEKLVEHNFPPNLAAEKSERCKDAVRDQV